MTRYVLIVSTLFLAAILVFFSSSESFWKTAAQSCCNPPPYSLPTHKFPLNSNVVVTISSAFTAAERNDIIAAFLDWNSENGTN